MNKRLELIWCIGLLCAALPALAIPEFAKALRYTPPPNFGCFELNHDPGDDPFSGDGPGFMFLANDQHSQVIFQVGWVGFSIGNHKVITYQRVGPAELKKLMEESGKGKGPLSPPVVIEKVSGLTAAKWVGVLPMTPGSPFKTVLVHRCWVQLETNIVLKITATAHDAKAFAALTNSLRTLSINKPQLLEALQPKKPQVSKSNLDDVEVGYMRWRGQRTAALVFRSQGGTFSFAAADGGDPDETVKDSREALAKMRDLSRQPNALRMAVVEMGRTGDRPEDVQRTCGFIAETNKLAIERLQTREFNITPLLMMWECWTNRAPEGFQMVEQYKVNATLLIRMHD